MNDLGLFFRQSYRILLALAVLIILFVIFISLHPAGFTMYVMTILRPLLKPLQC